MKIKLEGKRGVIGDMLNTWLTGPGDKAQGMKLVEDDPDVAVLCLPPEQAVERAKAYPADVVVIDASNAHRQTEGWTYGMAYWPDQLAKIAAAKRIAAPGCYATPAVMMLRPLADKLPDRLTIHGISGYSGGGRDMIRDFKSGREGRSFIYATHMEHPQSYEIEKYAGLNHRPMFVPSVGNFLSGMIVSIGLNMPAGEVLDIWEDWYGKYDGEYKHIEVHRAVPSEIKPTGGYIGLYAAEHDESTTMAFGASNNAITSAGTIMDILYVLLHGKLHS